MEEAGDGEEASNGDEPTKPKEQVILLNGCLVPFPFAVQIVGKGTDEANDCSWQKPTDLWA